MSTSVSPKAALHLSGRIQAMAPSPTMAMDTQAREVAQQGHRVLNLALGEPDFDTPEHIKEAAYKAIRDGKTKYTPSGGIPELKEAICQKFSRENRVTYQPDEVVVCVGGKHALYNVFVAICDPGDEVLVPVPTWQTFLEQIRLADGKPVPVPLGSDHQVRRHDLEPYLSERTRAILLNSPSNPTGAVMDPAEVEAVAALAVERGIYLVADETYEHYLYDGAKHLAPASLNEEARRWTIEVNTVSKSYAMTGWRVGYAAGPAPVIKAVNSLMSQTASHATSIAQWASVAALSGPQDSVQTMVEEFAKRRQMLIEGFHRLGMECAWPRGAFFAYPQVPGGAPSLPYAEQLLTDAYIATVPGSAFLGEGYLRVSYAASTEVLQEALDRLASHLGGAAASQ